MSYCSKPDVIHYAPPRCNVPQYCFCAPLSQRRLRAASATQHRSPLCVQTAVADPSLYQPADPPTMPDFRSDTVTHPSPEMRKAMAEVGAGQAVIPS